MVSLDFKSSSQHNEDGLLLWIFNLISEDGKYCVEFGAWDGEYLSNTFNLISKHGWFGLLIEGDRKRAKKLRNNYPFKNQIKAVNKFVGWSSSNSLEFILNQNNVPLNFELLSIDIDGNDYHVWKALQKFKPKVVVIEFNPEIPNDIEFIQEANKNVRHGSSLKAMTNLANEKGYELVAVTPTNAFYVDSIYYPRFSIVDNSIEALNPQKPFPRVFQLYDGTVVLTESFDLLWSKVNVGKLDLQKIPYFFRNNKANLLTKVFRTIVRKIIA